MKTKFKFQVICFVLFITSLLFGCKEEETVPRNDNPNVPNNFLGRDVDVQGTVNIKSRTVKFYLWDSGTVDGDIVSFYVNGNKLVDTYTLEGPSLKREVSITLDYEGYNYILLYAHNEGDLSPNTCALSYDDGSGEKQITISADLSTNGAYNIIVN